MLDGEIIFALVLCFQLFCFSVCVLACFHLISGKLLIQLEALVRLTNDEKAKAVLQSSTVGQTIISRATVAMANQDLYSYINVLNKLKKNPSVVYGWVWKKDSVESGPLSCCANAEEQ